MDTRKGKLVNEQEQNNKFCIKVLNKEHGKDVTEYLMSSLNITNNRLYSGSRIGNYYYINFFGYISFSSYIPKGYKEVELSELLSQREKQTEKKPIDKVTTDNLRAALVMCNIDLATELIDKIIDLVELIEEKGDETTLSDISKVQASWKA